MKPQYYRFQSLINCINKVSTFFIEGAINS